MGKKVTDGFLDGGIDKIATATVMTLCTAEPTSIAECDSLSVIPGHTLTSGDFTKANGDTSGRKVTVGAQNGLSLDVSGTATHVTINDGTDYYVTTAPSQGVTSGGTISIGAWDIEFADPV